MENLNIFKTNTPNHRHASKSMRIYTNNHEIQCSCYSESRSFITRKYLQFVPRHSLLTCPRAALWLSKCGPPRNADEIYQDLLESNFETPQYLASVKQIELDLNRTFPDENYFSNKSKGKEALRRVLLAFSKYDHVLGYVQGMNFIVAALLWHSSEVDAFWLFIGLMEEYELRDIYLPALPGLSKHCQIIQLICLDLLPRLHTHFAEHRITSEMYAAEWCFTLFGSVVPVREMVNILEQFFMKGWSFFYRIVIVLLGCLEEQLLAADDPIEILGQLKICHQSQKEWKSFMAVLDKGKRKLEWSELIERAMNLDLDDDYIKFLHRNFNAETRQFSLRKKHNNV